MKIYKKDTGEKYTPFDHFNMSTEVIFNPSNGSSKVNVTLSILENGSGSVDEVHEKSDQIFYVLQGTLKLYAEYKLIATAYEGDAVLVLAGEKHAAFNDEKISCKYIAITVPPLESTH